MPESVSTQFETLLLQLIPLARDQKSDLNKGSIDIQFAMLWKDMDVLSEVKLEQKPYEKENFDIKWRMTVHNWLKVKLLFYTSIK